MDLTRQQMILQLDHHLKGIPEKTVFTGSHQARFKTVGLCILSFAIGDFMLYRHFQAQASLGAAVIFLLIGLFFLILTIKKWNDVQVKIMELTHEHIEIKDLNIPIPLSHILDFHYVHDANDSLTLKVRQTTPPLALTTKTNALNGASVVVLNKENPEVVIIVPDCFMVNQRAIEPEQVSQILSAYLDIPQIKKQLIMM